MPATSTFLNQPTHPRGHTPRRHGPSPLILGVDPGLHRTGYGALAFSDGRPLVREIGVLTTSTHAPLGDRLHHLYRDMDSLLRELRPDVVVLEDLFVHGRFPRTAIVLGHARGIIYLAAAAAGVRIVALAPSAVKQAVAGSGRASKTQVQTAVRTLLGLRAVTNAHAADALALAYAGLYRTTSALRLRS
jgi:crossover junction endodeoxyribonuclease RuvC